MKQPEDIATLRERHQALARQRERNQAKLEERQKALDQLRKQALGAYGTDDLEELKARLEAMRQQNAERRRTYQELLDRIESDLDALDAGHAG